MIEITMPMPDDPKDIPKMAARGVDRIVVPVTNASGLTALINNPDDALKFGDVIAKYGDL